MIQANELRLGNYIYKLDNVMQVEDETFKNVSAMLFPYKPIPITEEWLLKLGFVSSDLNNSIRIHFEHLVDYRFEYYITKITNYHKEDMYFSGSSINNIKYVHQLQNLFFAVTQKELTL